MPFLLVLKSLWQMLEPRRRVYFVGLVSMMFVSGVFEMAGMLLIFGYIHGLSVDAATGRRSGKVAHVLEHVFGRTLDNTEFAIVGGTVVLLAIALKNAQALLVRFQMTRFLSNLIHRVSMQLFGALMAMPYEHVLRHGRAGLEGRLRRTLETFTICFRAASQILADGAMLLMVFCLLLFVDVRLTLFALLLFGGLGLGIYRALQVRLRDMGRIERSARQKVWSNLLDSFGGIVEARLRDNVRYFQSRYGKSLAEKMQVERRRAAMARVPGAANEVLLTTAITGSVLYLVLSGQSIETALPIIAVFGFAGLRANGAMSRTNSSFQTLRQRSEQFERQLTEVRRFAPKVLGSDDIGVPTYLAKEVPLPDSIDGRLHHSLELRNVSFRYPGGSAPVIRNVSLTIQHGQFVSFCGLSGSGKSTLVMLLIGLLRPTRGQVLCDGWDITHHIRAWQHNIGYVGQSAHLSTASIRENVAFGISPDKINDAKVRAALKLAAALEFVDELPEGIATPLLADGLRLSGGQKQRIIIARALYHDPDIVIFDEATAALDNITEREITSAAVRLSRTKTVVCIAHRLSTIRSSDVIHLLKRGRIIASGSYDALLATSPEFRALASSSTQSDGEPTILQS